MIDIYDPTNKGWVKNYRQVVEWGWYRTPHMFHLFSHLIMKANWEDKQWQDITVKRGQFVTSLASLSKDTGISTQSIRTCLERLKSTGEITDISTNKYRIITIIKYDSYQSPDETPNNQINKQTNIQVTSNQQATNNNEEYKNIRIKELKNKRSIIIPPSIKDVSAYCQDRKNNIDPEKWFDHYTSNGWMVGKNKMRDWKAAIRTWERNENGTPKREESEFI